MKVGLLILLYLTFVFWVLDADINLERMLVLNLLSMIYVLSLYPFMYLGSTLKRKITGWFTFLFISFHFLLVAVLHLWIQNQIAEGWFEWNVESIANIFLLLVILGAIRVYAVSLFRSASVEHLLMPKAQVKTWNAGLDGLPLFMDGLVTSTRKSRQ